MSDSQSDLPKAAPKEKSSFLQRSQRLWTYQWKKLLRLGDTQHAIALGFALGVFVSFTPLIFFHLILAAILAWILRGNIIASALGTFVGNPFTFPFIWLGIYYLGALFLGEGALANLPSPLTGETLIAYAQTHVWDVFLPMMIGGVLMGGAAGILFYPIIYYLVGAYRRRRRRRRHG